MTKFLIAVSLCFSYCYASAQMLGVGPTLYQGVVLYSDFSMFPSQVAAANIQSKKTFNHPIKKGKAGAAHQVSEVQFTKKGDVQTSAFHNKKGEVVYQWATEFNPNGLPENRVTSRKNNQLVSKNVYTYNPDNHLVKSQYFKGKNLKLMRSTETTWNELHKRAEVRNFATPKNRLSSYEKYDYFEDGQLKTVSSFNRKDKPTRTTSYTCNPKGKTIKKIEREVCTKTDEDEAGNIVKTYESTDHKLRTIRQVRVYDKNHHLLKTERYNYKGELTRKQVYTYNDQWQKVGSTVTNHKNKTRKVLYEYNEAGLVAKRTDYKPGKSTPSRVQSYSYTYYKG